MRNIIFVLILSVSLINALNSTTAEEIQNDTKTILQHEVTSTITTTPKLRNALNSTTAEEIQNDTKTILQDEVTSTIRTTPNLRLPGVNDPFVHFKSREHAWEFFFMSLSICSGNKLFKAKLLYTRSIMIQSMDKFWDEPYMKILLFFPIYDFKYSEHITIGKTFKCFHEVLSDPFDMQQTIRISDNSLM
ncbi:uncharacterized protein LOC115231167 isoform X4 [Octopus sinensis]|uniref:Uncharacterized protein LOC115231167 isoform X4 n=1 Tax=Octopus sinensis TaxID=2607531 RepID=A0A7E6EKK7_9MOLL|nr:uncharacterized protein LOC115231167 isoform X4 [Octopus sinensis]